MPAPSVIGKGTASASTGTTVTPTYPSDIITNDFIILLSVYHDYNAGGVGAAPTLNIPSGFSTGIGGANLTFDTHDEPDPKHRLYFIAYWKRASGSENGTISVTRSSAGNDPVFMSQIYVIRRAAITGNPFGTRCFAHGEVSTVNLCNVPNFDAGNTVAAIVIQGEDSPVSTTPSGYSSLGEDVTSLGPDLQLCFFYKENQTSAPATTASNGSSNGWHTIHMEVNAGPVTYPTEAITRVTGLVHRYSPGSYTLEIILGGATVGAAGPGLGRLVGGIGEGGIPIAGLPIWGGLRPGESPFPWLDEFDRFPPGRFPRVPKEPLPEDGEPDIPGRPGPKRPPPGGPIQERPGPGGIGGL